MDIVQYLMDKGYSLRFMNSRGVALFHVAADAGFNALIPLLMVVSPDYLDLPEEGGYTPLIYAVLNGRVDTVANLLDVGADPYQVSSDNTSLLMFALQSPRNVLEML